MQAARSYQSAVLLKVGRVLVVSGDRPAYTAVDIYDPASGTFTAAAPLTSRRGTERLALLSDGRVLVVGGMGADQPLASAELYTP
jgi:hypothetical protein